MVDKIYRDTDVIFTTSASFVDAIVNRDVKVDGRKVHYWPQYAEEFYKPMDKEEAEEKLKRKGISIEQNGSFKIAFTGNIGYAQGLDILPKTAELFKSRRVKNVQFVIVGDGRYQAEFEDEIKKRDVDEYFIMIPRQNPETIPAILAMCDVAFLSFMDTELFEKTIPAKLQSYMACGMPILAAAKGETERIINEAGCGICCEIGNRAALAESIVNMQMKAEDPEAFKKIGFQARAYFESHFDKKMLMDQMDEWFKVME